MQILKIFADNNYILVPRTCANSFCSPNATCSDVNYTYACACNAGYTGDAYDFVFSQGCQRLCILANYTFFIIHPIHAAIDWCANKTCGFGATCKNSLLGAECSCPSGTTGDPAVACTSMSFLYLWQINWLSLQDQTCANITCGPNSSCFVFLLAPFCLCNTGYDASASLNGSINCTRKQVIGLIWLF